MPPNEPLKPFGKATLKDLLEESCRLKAQAEKLRKRMADVAKVIDAGAGVGAAQKKPTK
jgi:hypothetical protein